MSRTISAALLAWFGILAMEGVLRYLGVGLHAPWIIYGKDVIIVGLLAVYAGRVTIAGRVNRTILLLMAVLLYGMVVGFLHGLAPVQVLFGAKMMLPFLAGYVTVREYRVSPRLFTLIYRIWVPLAVAGIALDWAFVLPWSGASYELAGTAIEASRQWGMFGLDRPAGFGRSSFGTATFLVSVFVLYLSAVGTMNPRRSRAGRLIDLLLTCLLFGAVLVTTSKSAILAMVVVTIAASLYRLHRRGGPVLAPVARGLTTALLLGTLLFGIVPPAVSLTSPAVAVRALQLDTIAGRAMVYSLVERLQNTWPSAVALLSNASTRLIGRGIGGIGVAQYYFESALYNPADNVYIYLFVQFGGVLLLGFVAYLVYLVIRNHRKRSLGLSLILFCATLGSIGATLNVVESPALALTLGVLLALYHENSLCDH